MTLLVTRHTIKTPTHHRDEETIMVETVKMIEREVLTFAMQAAKDRGLIHPHSQQPVLIPGAYSSDQVDRSDAYRFDHDGCCIVFGGAMLRMGNNLFAGASFHYEVEIGSSDVVSVTFLYSPIDPESDLKNGQPLSCDVDIDAGADCATPTLIARAVTLASYVHQELFSPHRSLGLVSDDDYEYFPQTGVKQLIPHETK